VLDVRREGSTWVLALQLPFAEHDDLDVARHADELLVRVGPYRRALLLPDSLRGRPVTDAQLRDGALRVRFGERSPT
jgi:arsenite-transporting ATPase